MLPFLLVINTNRLLIIYQKMVNYFLWLKKTPNFKGTTDLKVVAWRVQLEK